MEGLCRRIGNGQTNKFWTDTWLEKTIADNITLPSALVDQDAMVFQFILGGAWDSNSLFAQVPADIALKIIGIPLPMLADVEDKWIWKYTSNAQFT